MVLYLICRDHFKAKLPAWYIPVYSLHLWRSACGFSWFNKKNAEIAKHKEITQHILCIKVVVAGQCSSLLLTLAKKNSFQGSVALLFGQIFW